MAWILIIFYMGGMDIQNASYPMATKQACEEARVQIIAESPWKKTKGLCVATQNTSEIDKSL